MASISTWHSHRPHDPCPRSAFDVGENTDSPKHTDQKPRVPLTRSSASGRNSPTLAPVDFIGYAEESARLLNAEIASVSDLKALIESRAWLLNQCTERDPRILRKFQKALRPVFEAAHNGDTQIAIKRLNDLMVKHPIRPQISNHQPQGLHLHVANTSSIAELLIGECLLGLSALVCDLGPARFGTCSATPCTNVFVDVSPNMSRRYCSDRCSSRANVAAYRARQKAEPSA